MKPGCQVFGRKRSDPGSGQLEGQRHSVEVSNNVGYSRSVCRVEFEAGSDKAGTIDEQLDGFGFGQLGDIQLII